MNGNRLKLEHLYDDPIVKRKHYHQQLAGEQPSSPISHNLKIQTHKINLFSDYDLPLKQLQYTQTRQYKQNLNPIFQQLSTTNDRYSYSREWDRKCKNDDLPVSDRYFGNQYKRSSIKRAHNNSEIIKDGKKRQETKKDLIKRQEKSKLVEMKERQRILSENVKKGDKRKTKMREVPEHDTIFSVKNTILGPQNNEQLTCQELANVYLQKMHAKTQQLQISLKESQQKVSMLSRQVEMHKQKSLIKQRQLFYLQQEKQSIINKSRQLSDSLKEHSSAYVQMQQKFNLCSKGLRERKQQVKKERSWLEEEREEIKGIERKIEEVLGLMREAEEEEERREMLVKEVEDEAQVNSELREKLAEQQEAIDSVTGQMNLIEQQTGTLQMHLDQLLSLQQKFHQQTDSLITTIDQLNEQIASKHQFIQQEPEIDQLIKQVELEMGQISERKIIVEQEIHEVNVKISLKERNLRHIKQQMPKKDNFARGFNKGSQPNPKYYSVQIPQHTQNEDPKHHNQFSFTSLGNKNINQNTYTNNSNPQTRLHPPAGKQPLPTIRQQSNNTSAYHSPKVEEHLKLTQRSPNRYDEPIDQPSNHHLQSQSLQIDSRMISRAQILKPHQEDASPKKPKKYFVIESEDDANLSNSNSAFKNPKSYLQYQSNAPFDAQQNLTSQMFVQRQKKPSIQHRLYEAEQSVLRTQHEPQHTKKSFSAELQSSNYFHSANNRLESQQSQFPVIKLPPKSNDQKHSRGQKPQQKPNTMPYSNTHHNRNEESPRSSAQESQDVFESLIEQYQQIKSNSCFEESWKHKI